MKQQAGYFTPAALTLSVVTAALADGIPQGVPVRSFDQGLDPVTGLLAYFTP